LEMQGQVHAQLREGENQPAQLLKVKKGGGRLRFFKKKKSCERKEGGARVTIA